MADKNRTFAAPATSSKFKRQSTVPATNSRKFSTPAVTLRPKEKAASRTKVNKNTTIISEHDLTVNNVRQDSVLPDFDASYRQIAYGKFLRAMLEECVVDEKIQREETIIDIQMSQLADRFQKTMDQLDKTNKRLKDINFVVEQKRLLDLKSQDCSTFYEMTDKSNVHDLVDNLSATEQSCLDKLETKNVDFGYNMESGHKQLLDAVTEAIEGLEQIKAHSKLDAQKFAEYDKSGSHLKELEKDRLDLESLKADFDNQFPKFSEKLLKEASEQIAMMMKADEDDDESSDDD